MPVARSNLTGGKKIYSGVITTTYTSVVGDDLLVDTSSAGFTLTLPASPSAGDKVRISDMKGTFGTNNLTIGRNGSNIEGSAADVVLDTVGYCGEIIFIDSTRGWRFFNARYSYNPVFA